MYDHDEIERREDVRRAYLAAARALAIAQSALNRAHAEVESATRISETREWWLEREPLSLVEDAANTVAVMCDDLAVAVARL